MSSKNEITILPGIRHIIGEGTDGFTEFVHITY